MALDYVSADLGGYDSFRTTTSYSSYRPLEYVSAGSDNRGRTEIVTGSSTSSVFSSTTKKDDGYHFGDGTKAVLKGTGKVVGGALGAVGNVLEFTGDVLGGIGAGYGMGAGFGFGFGLGMMGFPFGPMWGGLWHHHHHHHHPMGPVFGGFHGPIVTAPPIRHFNVAHPIGPHGIRVFT